MLSTRLSTGKVKKKELRSRGVTAATWDSELEKNAARDSTKPFTANFATKDTIRID